MQAKEHLLKNPWTIAWLLSGLWVILFPSILWSCHRGSYYRSYGAARKAEDYYEQQQEYYKQQQQNNGNRVLDQYYNNYYEEPSYYKDCSWINWVCRVRQYNYAIADDNGDQQEDNGEQRLPWWYIVLGGQSEEMQRWEEENTGVRDVAPSTAGMKFVYTWTLLLFIGLLVFGVFSIAKIPKDPSAVLSFTAVLAVTASVAFMNLIMTTQGVISTDDKDLEDSYYGWYGQWGVLVAYMDFWIMICSLAFIIAFQVRAHLEKKSDGVDKEGEGSEYKSYAAPDESQMT